MSRFEDLIIHTDIDKLDTHKVHKLVHGTHWGKSRSVMEMRKSMGHSLNFGIFLNSKLIGYARVITDYTIFAYLLDVVIAPGERGKGYGSTLIENVLDHKSLRDIKTWKLVTDSAPALYKKFGFSVSQNPHMNMEKKLKE